MNERDELGKLLFTLPVSDRAADTAPEIMVLCDEAAEYILESGYRKPRVVHEDYAMEAIDKVLEQYYRTQLSPVDALNQIAAINGAYKMGERS